MARGPVEAQGLVLRDGDRVVLDVGNGAYWYLDQYDPMVTKHLGERVRVQGERSGFNSIDVVKVEKV